MYVANLHVPHNALSTAALSFQQLQELASATQSIFENDQQFLEHCQWTTLAISSETFPSIILHHNLLGAYLEPVAKSWADRDEDDDTLPPLPLSWFKSP